MRVLLIDSEPFAEDDNVELERTGIALETPERWIKGTFYLFITIALVCGYSS